MFSRCFSLSLLSLSLLSLVSSCLIYQQLSCLRKGQSLPICLVRPADTHVPVHAHMLTRTHTHRDFLWSLCSTCSTCLAERPCSAALCKHRRFERRHTFNIHTWKWHLSGTSQVTHLRTHTHMCVLTPKMSVRY